MALDGDRGRLPRWAAPAAALAALAAVALAVALAAPQGQVGAAGPSGQAGPAGRVELAAESAWAEFSDEESGGVRAEVGVTLSNAGGSDALAVTEVSVGLYDLALRDAVAVERVEVGRALRPGESAEVRVSLLLSEDQYAEAGAVSARAAGRAVEVSPLPLGQAVTTVTDAKAALSAERERKAAEAAREEAKREEAAREAAERAGAAAGSASSDAGSDARRGDAGDTDAGGSPSAGEPADVAREAGEAAFTAAWGARLDAYLEGSPMEGLGGALARAAWECGTDPRLSAAVAAVETGKGARCAHPCNAWNWGSVSWNSWDEAVSAHEEAMSAAYGTDPLAKMARDGRPSSWKASVEAEMAKV